MPALVILALVLAAVIAWVLVAAAVAVGFGRAVSLAEDRSPSWSLS